MAHGIARRGLARQEGFSFVELLVALALLSTAVFAHLALYGSLFVEGQLGQQYLRAHWFSADWIAQSQASATRPGAGHCKSVANHSVAPRLYTYGSPARTVFEFGIGEWCFEPICWRAT